MEQTVPPLTFLLDDLLGGLIRVLNHEIGDRQAAQTRSGLNAALLIGP